MKSKLGKSFRVISIFALFILASACDKQSPKIARTDQCYKTFDEFAYVVPERDVHQEKILPLEPWKVEATLPESLEKPWSEYVMATRDKGSHSEIWVLRFSWGDNLGAGFDLYEFIVYRTDTRTWKTISANIDESEVLVHDLFVTKDGVLWGQNGGRNIIDTSPGILQAPVLSKFNDETESFEFVDNIVDIPAAWKADKNDAPHWAEVVLDSNEVFWIFLQNYGIYSYNPATKEVKYHTKMLSYNITNVVASDDGTFYLKVYDPNSMSFYIENNELFQYDPAMENIKPLDIPIMPWYDFYNILLDKSGRLWLDAEGYREAEGDWKALRPWSADYYQEWVGNMAWRWSTDPHVMMQSSDGRIWFIINHPDVIGKRGIAWFDPESEEGCWFTSAGDNLVEDSYKNLWLVVDDKLYRYSVDVK